MQKLMKWELPHGQVGHALARRQLFAYSIIHSALNFFSKFRFFACGAIALYFLRLLQSIDDFALEMINLKVKFIFD